MVSILKILLIFPPSLIKQKQLTENQKIVRKTNVKNNETSRHTAGFLKGARSAVCETIHIIHYLSIPLYKISWANAFQETSYMLIKRENQLWHHAHSTRNPNKILIIETFLHQVVTLATYVFFIFTIIGRQKIDGYNVQKPMRSGRIPLDIDLYIPVFTVLQEQDL